MTTTSVSVPINLYEYLEGLRGTPIYHVINTGNAGDALIHLGTIQVFRSVGLDVRYLDYRSAVPEGQVVVCSGGGNLVPVYSGLAKYLETHHRKFRRLIVLPHTFGGHEELLRKLGPKADLFCREPRSYEYLNSLGLESRVELSEDMALHLDARKVLHGWPTQSEDRASLLDRGVWRNRLKFAIRSRQGWAKALRDPSSGRLRLNAFRDDVERTDVPLPPNNLDVSVVFSSRNGYYTPQSALQCGRALLRFLDGFDEIHTNRLHAAIGGLLLGKDVYLSPNSYHKLESIYRFSLKERFPNAHWNATERS